jgi:hypothetical protein
MRDIPDTSEKQSLQSLEAHKAVEGERLRQMLDKAKEARPPEHYIKAARAGAAEHPDHIAKAQGRAGERVALQEIKDEQGRVADLNKAVGPNFPIYDVAGPESVASVKVHGIDDGPQLKQSNLDQYRNDFEEAIGLGSGRVEPALGNAGSDWSQAKFNNAARYLHEQAKTNDAFPRQLAQSPEEAANYLRQNAELKIPSDHAKQVQADLRQRLFSDDAITREVQARLLGLDVNSPNYQAEAEKMISRVKELPITSAQIRTVLNDRSV